MQFINTYISNAQALWVWLSAKPLVRRIHAVCTSNALGTRLSCTNLGQERFGNRWYISSWKWCKDRIRRSSQSDHYTIRWTFDQGFYLVRLMSNWIKKRCILCYRHYDIRHGNALLHLDDLLIIHPAFVKQFCKVLEFQTNHLAAKLTTIPTI